MNRGCKIGLLLFASVAAVLGYCAWWGLSFLEGTVKPRYAVEWTTLFIVEHLEENNGRWPISWSDLRDDFDSREVSSYASDFDELQTLVEVRWDIQLPKDRELFDDESIQIVRIPESNQFKSSLEPSVIQWNRELRGYVIGKPSNWLQSELRDRRRRDKAVRQQRDSE
ncbi:MAG: hypothetical protein AB8G99_15950 [Planctomycetaceae bacterium]